MDSDDERISIGAAIVINAEFAPASDTNYVNEMAHSDG